MAAAAAQTFQQQWHPGRRVQEVAAPHRKGTIVAVLQPGPNATIVVRLDGWHAVSFSPAQLILI